MGALSKGSSGIGRVTRCAEQDPEEPGGGGPGRACGRPSSGRERTWDPLFTLPLRDNPEGSHLSGRHKRTLSEYSSVAHVGFRLSKP